MVDPLEIRTMEPGDVPAIARIHLLALPGDPLAGLGRRYLEGSFYPAALGHPLARCFVGASLGRVAGFHLCCKDSTRFRREVLAATRGAMARALLVRPAWWRFVLAHVAGALRRAPPPPWAGEPEIFLLATDAEESRRTPLVARRLLHAGFDWLRDEGHATCICHIDASNERTRRLARGVRMREIGSERRGPRAFSVWRREL